MYKDIVMVDNQYLTNKEDLKNSLIGEIYRDTLENHNDKDIVKNNFDLLQKIYEKDNNIDFYINELELFGYDIVKYDKIISNLKDLQVYFKNIASDNLEVQIGNMIDDLLKKLHEYWYKNIGL